MAHQAITCKVVDRRTQEPAVGMDVILRCIDPRPSPPENRCLGMFRAKTDGNGYITRWPGVNNPEYDLIQFLHVLNSYHKTVWQMGILASRYFAPQQCQYTLVDVNFVISRGAKTPHITVSIDTHGYAAHLESVHRYPFFLERAPLLGRLSQAQNKALTEHFVDEPYPSKDTYQRLSEHLRVPPQKTMQWFRRKRARGRSEQRLQESAPEPETSLPQHLPGNRTHEDQHERMEVESPLHKTTIGVEANANDNGTETVVDNASNVVKMEDSASQAEPASNANIVEFNGNVLRRSARNVKTDD